MRRAVVTGGVGVAATAAWWKVFTPWQRNWGATEEEVAMSLPGDELTPPPVEQNTRAITIAAPPEQVWPWLVQMGADRGGFYSYAWLENLFGLKIHNADRIVDDWQQLAVGDWVWGARNRIGRLDRRTPGAERGPGDEDRRPEARPDHQPRRGPRLRVPVDLRPAAHAARQPPGC